MKKTLLIVAALLALSASAALARGVNFAWGNACYTTNPVSVMTYACTSNSGGGAPWNMSTSFVIDSEMTDMVGIEVTIEGMSSQSALPDWWKAGTGDCRTGKISWTSKIAAYVDDNCQDWTNNGAFDIFGYTWNDNLAHISAGEAIDASTPFTMAPGVEYLGGQVSMLNGKTVGTGSCAGCSFGMIWGLKMIVVAGLDGRRDELTEPISGGNHCLQWNTSSMSCVPPVPTNKTTWGQVKGLYR